MLFEQTEFLIHRIRTLPQGHKICDLEMDKVVSCFESNLYNNKDVFSKKGDVSRVIGIVYSGSFKSETTDVNNKTKLRGLYYPAFNGVMVDWTSYSSGIISDKSITAKCESIVLSISQNDLNGLCDKYPCFSNSCRGMISNSCNAREQMLLKLEDLSLAEKKLYLEEHHPGLMYKIENKDLAFICDVGKNFNKKK
jgi:hypothetical protein